MPQGRRIMLRRRKRQCARTISLRPPMLLTRWVFLWLLRLFLKCKSDKLEISRSLKDILTPIKLVSEGIAHALKTFTLRPLSKLAITNSWIKPLGPSKSLVTNLKIPLLKSNTNWFKTIRKRLQVRACKCLSQPRSWRFMSRRGGSWRKKNPDRLFWSDDRNTQLSCVCAEVGML